MTTQQVADRYYELAQTGNWKQIRDEFYSADCQSIEPEHAEAQGMKSVQGLAAIEEKDRLFAASIEEMHGGFTNPPIVSGNHFAVVMGMDVTFKGAPRMNMDEIAVFQVENGKIVKEQFFY